MSTVTTRLCQYGHPNCYKHMNQTQVVLTAKQHAAKRATEAKRKQNQARCQATITKIEAMWAAGSAPKEMVDESGWKGPYELRRMLSREGRDDLAELFVSKRRPPNPGCASGGCEHPAIWIEDPAVEEDDEPIAQWARFCQVCQDFEDLCEDLEFLLDPTRGGETDVFRVAGRLGYGFNFQGAEALRRRLGRHGRMDLRSRLNITSVKDQRGWATRGSVRSDISSHWVRLVSSEEVRAYEREVADPGQALVGSMFR